MYSKEDIVKIQELALKITNHCFVAMVNRDTTEIIDYNRAVHYKVRYPLFDPTYRKVKPYKPTNHDQEQKEVGVTGLVTLPEMLNTQNKTTLISTLTNQSNTELVKANLIALCQFLIQKDLTNNWHLQILVTPFAGFNLINAFMTNNLEPQYLNLGIDVLNQLYFNRWHINYDPLNESYHFDPEKVTNLLNVTYSWQTEKPSLAYQKQLIKLDPQQEWSKILPKIDQTMQRLMQKTVIKTQETYANTFVNCLKKEIQRNLNKKTKHDIVLNNSHLPEIPEEINVLDLQWFLDTLEPFKAELRYDQDAATLKQVPEIKQALNALAQAL